MSTRTLRYSDDEIERVRNMLATYLEKVFEAKPQILAGFKKYYRGFSLQNLNTLAIETIDWWSLKSLFNTFGSHCSLEMALTTNAPTVEGALQSAEFQHNLAILNFLVKSKMLQTT